MDENITETQTENMATYSPIGNIYQKGNEFTQQSLTKAARRKARRAAKAAALAAEAAIPEDGGEAGRRVFTSAEKSAALRRTGGICACCGKKLTVGTMTAEHVIPLSWGGTNAPENIIALCEACNKRKGGMLFLPEGFYAAISGTPAARQLGAMFEGWFREEQGNFDLESFPLIAPETDCLIVTAPRKVRNNRKPVYSPQFVVKWKIAGYDREAEIEELTGMTVDGIRKRMCDLEEVEDTRRVALYTQEKVSTGHVMMLAAVMYRAEKRAVAVWTVWSDTGSNAVRVGTENLCSTLIYSLVKVAGREVTHFDIYSTVPGALDGIRRGSCYRLGIAWCENPRPGVADSVTVAVVHPKYFDKEYRQALSGESEENGAEEQREGFGEGGKDNA